MASAMRTPIRSHASARPRTSLAGWMRAMPETTIAPSTFGAVMRCLTSAGGQFADAVGIAPKFVMRDGVVHPGQLGGVGGEHQFFGRR